MSDDKVIEFDPKIDNFFRGLVEKPATKEEPAPPAETATPADAAAEPAADGDDGKVVPFEKLSLLPGMDDPYIAHARPVNASLPMLTVVLKDGHRMSFSYGDLRLIDMLPPKRPGQAPGLLLRFFGVGQAELWSSHSDRLHGHLHLHRLAWIRELPDGRVVRDDSAVVITGMTIELLEK